MEIEKIYIDLDGVLADFQGGLVELCHIAPIDQAHKTRADDDRMFAAMREINHFYSHLAPLPGAVEMFHAIYDRYGDRCEILTGIPKPWRHIEHAAEDKTEWVHRLLSPDVVVHTPIRAEKLNYCHGKASILIDDFIVNIKEWEGKGGTGILHRTPETTLRRLKDLGIL